MLVSATRSALCRALRRNAGALPLTDRSRHLHHQPYPQAPRAQGRDSAAAASHGADPGRVRAARAPPPASPALPVPQPRPTCSARVPSVTRSSPVKSRSPFFEGCRPQAQEIFGRQKKYPAEICNPVFEFSPMLRLALLAAAALGAAAGGTMGPHDSGAAALRDCAPCLRLRGGGNVLSKLRDMLPNKPQRSGHKIIISGPDRPRMPCVLLMRWHARPACSQGHAAAGVSWDRLKRTLNVRCDARASFVSGLERALILLHKPQARRRRAREPSASLSSRTLAWYVACTLPRAATPCARPAKC